MTDNQNISHPESSREKFAFISFLLGISSITVSVSLVFVSTALGGAIFEIMPILLLPFTLIFGILGLKSKRRGLAITGIILNIICPLVMIFLG